MPVPCHPAADTKEPPIPSEVVQWICVIDDRPIVRAGTADLPGDAAARTVGEVEENAERYDLVVLDLRLDGRSGAGDDARRPMRRGARILVFTPGDGSSALRATARQAVVGSARASARDSVPHEAVRSAARTVAVAPAARSALRDADARPADARLSPREREVLALYASGESAKRVASLTGLSRVTVTHYVGRIRAKYARAGREAGTKVELYIRAIEDGLLTGPG